ncbi:MAG: pyrroline-5-carboxylate reductase [Gammaproteobacteria bacterium]|jgi:pyrroline-5-carboxylate reductase|nr:pyrroline-5-carboxylate reductase [Gammaproteobacteria bacterium]
MSKLLNVGIIGGTGWMGKAMGHALLKHFVNLNELWVCNYSGKNDYSAAIRFTTNAQTLVDACDVVILSVLPSQFPKIEIDASQKLVISIMAMVPVAQIEASTYAKRIIRAMPNAAIPEGESYTPWFANEHVSVQDKKTAEQIFNCFGLQDELGAEDQLSFMTALTGSSHGWLAYFAESLIESGISHGLPLELVERSVRQVMKGVGRLIAHEAASPQQTVKILTDYKGTTAAGLNSFADSNIAELIREGIEASYQKAKSH